MAQYDEAGLERVRAFARAVGQDLAGNPAPATVPRAAQAGMARSSMLSAGQPSPMVDMDKVRSLARVRLGRGGGGFGRRERADAPRLGGDGRPVRTQRQVNPVGLGGVLGGNGRPNSASAAVLG